MLSVLSVQICVHLNPSWKSSSSSSRSSPLDCRLCNSQAETIQHLMARCPTMAPTSYLDLHISVASAIHLHLCRTFGIKTTGILTSHCLWLRIPKSRFSGILELLQCPWLRVTTLILLYSWRRLPRRFCLLKCHVQLTLIFLPRKQRRSQSISGWL